MVALRSDMKETLFSEIKEYGLHGFFDDVVFNIHDHDKEEGLCNLIKKYGLKRENTFFVGGSNHEIEVGSKNSIRTVALTRGF